MYQVIAIKNYGGEWQVISVHSTYAAAIKRMKHVVITEGYLRAEVQAK